MEGCDNFINYNYKNLNRSDKNVEFIYYPRPSVGFFNLMEIASNGKRSLIKHSFLKSRIVINGFFRLGST